MAAFDFYSFTFYIKYVLSPLRFYDVLHSLCLFESNQWPFRWTVKKQMAGCSKLWFMFKNDFRKWFWFYYIWTEKFPCSDQWSLRNWLKVRNYCKWSILFCFISMLWQKLRKLRFYCCHLVVTRCYYRKTDLRFKINSFYL